MRLILLLNMGGPNDLSEVGVFLKNMFNDPYILGIKSPILRKFVAFMITSSRLKTAQNNYRQIGGKSPICELTARLCGKISHFLDDDTAVAFAMNYTPPFAKDVLAEFTEASEIVVFPLYPHHSFTTVSSSISDFEKARAELNLKAKVKIVEPFFEDERYNEIIVDGIEKSARDLNADEITLVFSAHSLPQKMIDAGDIYEEHVKRHVQILTEILEKRGVKFKQILLAYQSKLGPVKWLEPSLNQALAEMKDKKALIYPISFCIDNSETVFELSKEFKRIADELKFDFYDVVACPNDDDKFAKFIADRAKE
ncbi:ferrochelatase [Campylobacter sp. Marseille-Q3452]|uniref:Ferrochelatase n=1 Tax=Campylobacter massiliensis TaxID=2762557 RepID=A0A842J6E2_9BACT|nr:ferrochelatase [Campylobacter massiliensis]MBC2883038.1 ferrochelatase [Campylobacter massiliensis]